MKYLVLIFALLILTAATPTKVIKADQAEWLKYSAYCRAMVSDTVRQVGYFSGSTKTTVLSDYTETNGTVRHKGDVFYTNVVNPDTVWLAVYKKDYQQNSLRADKTISYQIPNKKIALVRKKAFIIRQRRCTVRDFYEWWMIPGDKYYTTKVPETTIVQRVEIKP